MLNLDFSVFNWSLIQGFILKGLWFSIVLTIIATAGGIFFGTILALMRLSGRKWLDVPASIYVNGMRSIPLVMVILWFFLLVFRDECLNEHWFQTLPQARAVVAAWRQDFNEVRPHSSLGRIPPARFAEQHRQQAVDAAEDQLPSSQID